MKILPSIIFPWIMCGVPAATEPFSDAHDVTSSTNDQASRSDLDPGAAYTTTTLPITRISDGPPRREALRGFLLAEQSDTGKKKGLSTVDLVGTSYVAHVTIGTQTLPLLVDTGSSDLWVAPSSFVCLDASGEEAADQSACGFPSFYDDGGGGGASATVVPDEYFSIVYGNGQFAYGPYARESVSLGGVTVPGQQVALPSRGYVRVSSGDYAGLLGLAYPAMVPARRGGEPKPAAPDNEDPFGEHETWFFNAVGRNLTDPLFSMALDIDGGGLLGIGGIVDVPVVGEFVSTPILIVSLGQRIHYRLGDLQLKSIR